MYKRELKQVTYKSDVITSVICDHCGNTNDVSELPDDWCELIAYHNEWGNDSIDSRTTYLACSPKCYFEVLRKLADEFEGYESTEINRMTIQFVRRLLISHFGNHLKLP
jgi:hypothetical protein